MSVGTYALTILGSSSGTLGVLWAAATPTGGTDIGPYVGGGAGVIAVAALGEVTRRLLNGSLIPRSTRDAEAETAAYILAAGQREDRAMRLAEDASGMVVKTAKDLEQHTARLAADLAEVARKQVEHTDRTVTDLRLVVEDLRDEVREMRRGGRP